MRPFAFFNSVAPYTKITLHSALLAAAPWIRKELLTFVADV